MVMKIQLLSDLHNEFFRQDPRPPIEETEADVIVLAGDIDVWLHGLRWAAEEAERLGKPIVYVAGNHEYYQQFVDPLLEDMREFAAEQENLHFLENDQLIIDGVRFLGCTLWTDYKAAGDSVMAMLEVGQRMIDHRVIGKDKRFFLPEDALAMHRQSRAWLEERLAEEFEGATVVVSHHAPHLLCQHPAYPLDAFGTAFLSDLSDLVGQADVWCFGHSHANVDADIGKCRLISNQRGYPKENVIGYDPALVIDVAR